MPSSHRRYAEWTPQRMMREAAKIGPATSAMVETIMKAKPHPEQGFRSCLGIMRLVKTCRKLRVAFFEYLGHRLGVEDARPVPPLADLVRAATTTA